MAYDPQYIRFAVEHLCPGVSLMTDYELYDKGDGNGPFISAWFRAEIAQPTQAQIEAVDTAPLIPTVPIIVIPQDLMAQFTADDAAKIQAAVASNAAFWLLWQALTAQGATSMLVTNARFQAGWSALVTVLGQARMNVIATALGVPSLVVNG